MSVKLSVSELKLAADQCVKCAVCLPHCPTYALSPEETESPRGRITLLQGIVHERLAPTPLIHKHLDSCLSCGRCEQVCPANVPYTRLLDGGRFLMQRQPTLESVPVTRQQRLAAWLLASPRVLRVIATVVYAVRGTRVDRLLGNSIAGRALRWMPPSHRRSRSHDTPASVHMTALLFTGCLTDGFERDLADCLVTLTAAYGIELIPTPKGLCCGALYQHQGNERQSSYHTTRNLAALSGPDHPVVALQSGCSRGLIDGLNFSDNPVAKAAANRITDVFALLADSPTVPAMLDSSDRVGLYMPCSIDKKTSALIHELIQRDARVEVTLLGFGHGCCGAAGDHMLTRPERADLLAQPIVEEIIAAKLTHVLVPNIGCAWHLRANLSLRNRRVIVEHPLQWLARHLAQ